MSNFTEIVEAGKNFACSLYKAQPGAIIPNPLSNALHLVWDSFCDYPNNPGLPLPPAPSFSGGQCCATQYQVFYDTKATAEAPWVVSTYNEIWTGKIGAMQQDVQPNGAIAFYYFITSCSGSNFRNNLTTGNVDGRNWIRINRVVPLNGGANNCGDPPAQFPFAVPPPPTGFISPTGAITLNDGTNITVEFNFKPPVLPALPAVTLPPVIINFNKLGVNPEFKIPITFNFDGSINFGSPQISTSFNQDDRDNINNIKNVTNATNTTTTNIKNEINKTTNINNNKNPDPNDFKPPVDNIPPGEFSSEYLAWVHLTVTEVPKNAKTQSGNTAPDIYYAGWFEWKQASWNCPREHIHFRDNVFLAPKGVTGFAYTLYTGYKGRAKAIINKEKI